VANNKGKMNCDEWFHVQLWLCIQWYVDRSPLKNGHFNWESKIEANCEKHFAKLEIHLTNSTTGSLPVNVTQIES
jgi:hypothetical protein